VGDLAKRSLWIVLYGIGLGSATGLLYLVGPFLSIGGWAPFDSYIGRSIGILAVTAFAGSLFSFQWLSYRKKAKALTAAVAGGGATGEKPVDTDEVVLKDKLKDALATLKASSGSKKDYLYDLPWYLLIGPPGSGKTTALVNSGLKFPLSRGATPAAIAGIGGTRYCDWWFTDHAGLRLHGR
jgi:type VI secretion system protein ImpL